MCAHAWCDAVWSHADHVTEKLKELEQSVSLKQIRQLFEHKEYSMVVHKLEPFLEYNTSIPTEVTYGMAISLLSLFP